MTVERARHSNNTVLGNGEVYIDVYAGNPSARTFKERYLGDSVGATLSVTSERTTIQSGDGAVAQDLVDIVRSTSRQFGFTLRDSSIENWNLFLLGAGTKAGIGARSSDGSQVADETHGAVKKGQVVVLGFPKGVGNPMGIGKLSAKPTAKDNNSAETAANVETDAEDIDPSSTLLVDLNTGLVTALKDFTDLKVTYTPGSGQAATKRAEATADATQIECALRYIEDDPAAGAGRNLYIPKCNLLPSGESAFKSRDTEQQMAFSATVLSPGAGLAALIIDGVEL